MQLLPAATVPTTGHTAEQQEKPMEEESDLGLKDNSPELNPVTIVYLQNGCYYACRGRAKYVNDYSLEVTKGVLLIQGDHADIMEMTTLGPPSGARQHWCSCPSLVFSTTTPRWPCDADKWAATFEHHFE